MRQKMMMALAGLMLASTLSTAVFAEDVFVTKKGKRYHKAESRFIKGKEVTKMTREEAEAKGYKPSSEFEDVTSQAQTPATTKQEAKKK